MEGGAPDAAFFAGPAIIAEAGRAACQQELVYRTMLPALRLRRPSSKHVGTSFGGVCVRRKCGDWVVVPIQQSGPRVINQCTSILFYKAKQTSLVFVVLSNLQVLSKFLRRCEFRIRKITSSVVLRLVSGTGSAVRAGSCPAYAPRGPQAARRLSVKHVMALLTEYVKTMATKFISTPGAPHPHRPIVAR